MAEPAARIGLPTAFREPEGAPARGKSKEKPKPKLASNLGLASIDPGEPDEQDKHELDTIA
ncbi:MAG TPA: hypothetical protein VMJ93_10250 [Verrucomicrobiae bacterium]|nr:hypothetical protein [Verrucomicrobiae bacterium]